MSPFANALLNEPLSRHTSFRIGGPADFFLLPCTIDELLDTLLICKVHSIPFTVMGDGTNILVRDNGIRGAVISTKRMNGFSISECGFVSALAGTRISQLSLELYHKEFCGFEFAQGIPGTIGGAVYMNAGAYDGEIGSHVESVRVFCTGEVNGITVLSNNDLLFGYRSSILQSLDYVVLEVCLQLKKGIKHDIKKKMEDYANKRRASQPLDVPSAGSTFKRPVGGYAAMLIDKSGLKGLSIGGAQVSKKHAGFIVNIGNASADDVLRLSELVRKRVHDDCGVWLIPEIKVLGE